MNSKKQVFIFIGVIVAIGLIAVIKNISAPAPGNSAQVQAGVPRILDIGSKG